MAKSPPSHPNPCSDELDTRASTYDAQSVSRPRTQERKETGGGDSRIRQPVRKVQHVVLVVSRFLEEIVVRRVDNEVACGTCY
jgi:hypothetical protein